MAMASPSRVIPGLSRASKQSTLDKFDAPGARGCDGRCEVSRLTRLEARLCAAHIVN